MSQSDKLGKSLRKAVVASTKTPQASRDRVSNRKGLIEGVDSDYQWQTRSRKASKVYSAFEPMEKIGSRRKLL